MKVDMIIKRTDDGSIYSQQCATPGTIKIRGTGVYQFEEIDMCTGELRTFYDSCPDTWSLEIKRLCIDFD